MKLTLRMLEKWGACFSARMRFQRLFGEQVVITAKNVEHWRQASEREGYAGQDPGWIIYKALSAGRDDHTALQEAFVLQVDRSSCEGGDVRAALRKIHRWPLTREFGVSTQTLGKYFPSQRVADAIVQVLERL